MAVADKLSADSTLTTAYRRDFNKIVSTDGMNSCGTRLSEGPPRFTSIGKYCIIIIVTDKKKRIKKRISTIMEGDSDKMKNIKKVMMAVFIGSMMMVMTAQAATFSEFWKQDASGNWYVQKPDGSKVKDAWLCDDAVAENGKDVWYLLDANGKMLTAGLVQDGTGNFYSLETEHNGYYGMLRYKSGNYGGVNLTLEGSHNGSFAAVLNPEGIEALKAQYGVTSCAHINNGNIVYTSSFGKTSGGSGSAGSAGSAAAGSGAQQTSAGKYTEVGGPNRIAPDNGLTGKAALLGREVISRARWAEILNISPDQCENYYQLTPNEKYYYYASNGNRSKYNFGFVYEMNGDRLVTGSASAVLGSEIGTWVVDNTKPDTVYGKTNLRFRFPDGAYAGFGWHSGFAREDAVAENQALIDAKDPDYLTWSDKWTMYFTEDGYMVRNAIVTCEWNGQEMKAGYNGTWLDKWY